MSVYSGFASRSQEGSYNRNVYNLLCLLQMKVVHTLKGKPFDDTLLSKYFHRFYGRVVQLDECKYLPPKFSCALKDLASYYGINDKTIGSRSPSLESNSSRLSFQQFQANNSLAPDLARQESNLSIKSRSNAKFNLTQTMNECVSTKSSKRERPSMCLKSNHSITPQNLKLIRLAKQKKQPLPCIENGTSRSTINNNIIININRSYNSVKKRRASLLSQKNNKQYSNIQHIYSSIRPRKGRRGIAESPTCRQTSESRNQHSFEIDSLLNGGNTSNCVDLEVIKESAGDPIKYIPKRKGKIPVDYHKLGQII